MKQTVKDLGLGSKELPTGKRVINKDGSFNIKRVGLPLRETLNLYHSLVAVSWTKFILIVLAGYIVVNLFFAFLYFIFGTGQLSASAMNNRFLDCFFFSAQTFTTVGYGHISPLTLPANIIAAIESLTGLLALALATGLLYGRFSRPVAKLIYSKNAIIAPFKDITGLMFRVANKQKSQMVDLEVRVIYTELQDSGTTERNYYNLSLEYNTINFFPSVWTINHPIDENSPLYKMEKEEFKRKQVEIFILLKGFDDTFSQNVHSRFSYSADEIICGVKFKNIFGVNDENETIVELDKISEVEKV